MKLTIGKKIRGGLLIAFLMTLIIGGLAFYSVYRITNYIDKLERVNNANNQAIEMLQAHHIWLYNITKAFLFETEFEGNLDPTSCIWGEWRYSDKIYDIDDNLLRQLILQVDRPHARLHLDGARALEFRRQGLYDEAFWHLQHVVIPYGTQSTNAIAALNTRYADIWHGTRADLISFGNQVRWITGITFLAVFIIFVFMGIFIPRSVFKPINHLVAVLSDVSNGNFDINRNSNIVEDEIGKLTLDTYEVIDIVKNVSNDVLKYADEVMSDYEYKMDSSKYNGAFRELIDRINTVTNGSDDESWLAIDALAAIEKGNFNMEVRRLLGNRSVTSDTIESVLKTLKSLETDVSLMINATAVDGDLAFRIDMDKYEGDWRKFVKGLNAIALAVDKPIVEIREVMNYLSNGHTNKKIEGAYRGDFLLIKNSINSFVDFLDQIFKEINRTLLAIASGDLTVSITQDFPGEFAEFKNFINNITVSLNRTMSNISAASEQVLSGAKQISSSAMTLANGASQQANSVEELNATVDLINQQTQMNADNAYQANNHSSESTKYAHQGHDAMQQMLEAMGQIKGASDGISRVIKAIQEIAFQTNLLALNASVEAARAGEHGRGFAVVAEEVRNLAARSQEAAEETTGLIEDSINRVNIGSSIAKTTAKSLDTIVTSANDILQIIGNISLSSKDQAEAVGQVVVGLDQISQIVVSNSAISEETAASSQELTSQAEVLKELVSFFKV